MRAALLQNGSLSACAIIIEPALFAKGTICTQILNEIRFHTSYSWMGSCNRKAILFLNKFPVHLKYCSAFFFKGGAERIHTALFPAVWNGDIDTRSVFRD